MAVGGDGDLAASVTSAVSSFTRRRAGWRIVAMDAEPVVAGQNRRVLPAQHSQLHVTPAR
jgi:hypothetical protein